jgi:hypothetical protein
MSLLKFKPLVVGVGLGLAYMPLAQAADVDLNGFMTAAGGITLDDDEFVQDYDDNFSFNNDSVFALQVTAKIDPKMSVVAQFVARGIEDYKVDVSWAYISYQLTPNDTLLAGKFRLPFYEYSDYLDVGYAYHWIRPPMELYSIPISEVVGGSLQHSMAVADWDADIKGFYGAAETGIVLAGNPLANTTMPATMTTDNFTGLVASISRESLRFRLAYIQTDISVTNAATEGLRAGFPAPVADDILLDDKDINFWGFGAFYDAPDYFLGSEYTTIDAPRNGLLHDRDGWYLTGGYRFGNHTLHLTYAEVETDAESGFGAGFPEPIPTILAGVVASNEWKQSSWTIGWRHEINPSSAFKLEYAVFSDDLSGSNAVNAAGQPYSDGPNLIRFAIDVVF